MTRQKMITADIKKLIKTKVTAGPGPYLYQIRGTAGMDYSRWRSASVATDKLETWANKLGAELKLIEVTYDYNNPRGWITVEITDPAARYIDAELEGSVCWPEYVGQ